MKIEDFARYVDAIAPTEVPADTTYAGPGIDRDRRGSRIPALAAIAGLAAALVAVALIGVSTRSNRDAQVSTTPRDTASTSVTEPVTSAPSTGGTPSGRFTVVPPGGPTVTMDLADAVALDPDELLASHQVGLSIDTYGYDLTLYVDRAVPFDPCGRAQPCTEIDDPVTNAAGLVVRSWAPTLVPGTEPTSPTTFTVESPDGEAVLALPATFAGAPIPSDELVGAISHAAGSGTFAVTQEGVRHELTWVATMVRPRDAGSGSDWIVYITPTCEGAERCESGVGFSSLAPPSGDVRPIDTLVGSVTVGRTR